MKLTVYFGFDSLGSWLTLPGLRALPAGCELEVLPLLASIGDVTTKPGKDDPLAELKARRARARRAFHEAEHERKCARLGISLEAGRRALDPLPPAIGLQWLAERGGASAVAIKFAEGVFTSHYRNGQEVDSPQAIQSLLGASGAETAGFHEAYARLGEELEASRDEVLQSGILGSPTFMLDGEIFLGREHFPLVNWILGGRKGPPPV